MADSYATKSQTEISSLLSGSQSHDFKPLSCLLHSVTCLHNNTVTQQTVEGSRPKKDLKSKWLMVILGHLRSSFRSCIILSSGFFDSPVRSLVSVCSLHYLDFKLLFKDPSIITMHLNVIYETCISEVLTTKLTDFSASISQKPRDTMVKKKKKIQSHIVAWLQIETVAVVKPSCAPPPTVNY